MYRDANSCNARHSHIALVDFVNILYNSLFSVCFFSQIFFVLRKKDNQVTFLHLYHHSLTPLETWICVKFIAGGHGTLGNLINNAVHVVMYAYYMLSAMGPEYQKYLWWKKHLTTVQLVSNFYSWSCQMVIRKTPQQCRFT